MGYGTSLLATKFRESMSKCKDKRMSDEMQASVGYSTGFLAFDFTNGHTVFAKNENSEPIQYFSIGITDGSIVMFIGRTGCGKTTFAIQSGWNIVKQFPSSVMYYDDIEGGANKERITELCGARDFEDIKGKVIGRNTGVTAENLYERIKIIHDIKLADPEMYQYDTGLYDSDGNRIIKFEPTVYVLDSLAMLTPEKYSEEDSMSGQMSVTAAAKTNSQLFKTIIPMLKAANIIFYVINHINQNIDIGFAKKRAQTAFLKQDESVPGGNKPLYLSNTLLRFDDHTKMKEDEGYGISGNLVDITILKSRTARAGKVATLVFNPETGYDPELSLLQLLKDKKLIGGAGIGMYPGEFKDMKFSQKKFKEKLHTNPEFANAVMQTAKIALEGLLSKREDILPEDEEENDNNNFDITQSLLNSF